MLDFAKARSNMVDSQLRTTDVNDLAVLAAFEAVPRESFVPEARRALAYIDEDLDLAGLAAGPERRALMKPAVLAKLFQVANVAPSDSVLVVGATTGYAAAIAARLGNRVVALEQDPALVDVARRALAEAGGGDVKLVQGPLNAGWPDDAPYDVIVVCGAVDLLPDALPAQLADRGRLVCIEGRGLAGRGTVHVRSGADVAGRPVFNAASTLLPGFAKPKEFVF